MNAMLASHNEMLNDFIQMTRDEMGGGGGSAGGRDGCTSCAQHTENNHSG